MESPEKIESIANENYYDQDKDKSLVYGGVVFNEAQDPINNLNYTLRQRFSRDLSN